MVLVGSRRTPMAYGRPNSSSKTPLLIIGGVFALCAVALLVLRLVNGDVDEALETDDATGDAVAVLVPDDAGYPDPPADGEWDTDNLDEETYVQVTAESTCAAQRFHGPPAELTREMDRIYFHYKTTSLQIADYASEINADDSHAIRVGERIADAIERCP
jgi:hypothetical protein